MHWTNDGSILTVTCSNGYFLGFLTVIPSLCSSFDIYAGLLSSLTEISVVDCSKNNMVIVKSELEIEPSFLQMGVQHFAVGINNQIWYYKWRQMDEDSID
jgi:WD repeat-containing protein 19